MPGLNPAIPFILQRFQYFNVNGTYSRSSSRHAARSQCLLGKPAEAIVETAKEKGADLIVLGSHGRTGLDRLLMGSVAERVLVMTTCAVLVVKGK